MGGVSAVNIHRLLGTVCGEGAPRRRTVFRWVESFNSGHETVKKESVQAARQQPVLRQVCSMSPSPLCRTGAKPMINCKWHLFFEQHSMHNPRRFKGEEGLFTLGSKRSHTWTRQKGAELPGAAHSSQEGPRGIIYQTDYKWWVLNAIHSLETWSESSSEEISDSTFSWKADGLSILGCGGIMLIEWLPQGQTINSEVYFNTLTCICRRIQLRRQGKCECQVPLLHDNARPQSSKRHWNWHRWDIPSNHIHHILQIWPHRTMLCSTKWRTTPREKIPCQWRPAERCPRLYAQ